MVHRSFADEYLNYALKNREEWKARGEEVVTEMMENAKNYYGMDDNAEMSAEDAQEQAGDDMQEVRLEV